jgi:hypothetical protein
MEMGAAAIAGDKDLFDASFVVDEETFKAIDLKIQWKPQLEKITLSTQHLLEFKFNETLLQPSDFIMD